MRDELDLALNGEPAVALVALRRLRLALDEAEKKAVRAAIGQGWNYSAIAERVGVSRQAVAAKLQRDAGDRRPKARVIEQYEEDRRRQREEDKVRIARMLAESEARRRANGG